MLEYANVCKFGQSVLCTVVRAVHTAEYRNNTAGTQRRQWIVGNLLIDQVKTTKKKSCISIATDGISAYTKSSIHTNFVQYWSFRVCLWNQRNKKINCNKIKKNRIAGQVRASSSISAPSLRVDCLSACRRPVRRSFSSRFGNVLFSLFLHLFRSFLVHLGWFRLDGGIVCGGFAKWNNNNNKINRFVSNSSVSVYCVC